MSKIIVFGLPIILIGTTVVAWSQLTGPQADVDQLSSQARAVSLSSQEVEPKTDIKPLPSEKILDMTFVFSDGDEQLVLERNAVDSDQ